MSFKKYLFVAITTFSSLPIIAESLKMPMNITTQTWQANNNYHTCTLKHEVNKNIILGVSKNINSPESLVLIFAKNFQSSAKIEFVRPSWWKEYDIKHAKLDGWPFKINSNPYFFSSKQTQKIQQALNAGMDVYIKYHSDNDVKVKVDNAMLNQNYWQYQECKRQLLKKELVFNERNI